MTESDTKDQTAKAIAAISNSIKTETRARMLLALKKSPMRPKDVLRLSTESPSTIYRAVDQLIEAGVISREGGGDQVVWSLTPLGTRLVDSMVNVVSGPGISTSEAVSSRKRYQKYIEALAPAALFAFAAVRGVFSHQVGWVIGGALLALILYVMLRYVFRR
ncbi:MAG: winged helix-turn-helix transcriptional regulator [Nitrososphaerota archaeon]|nr:winged helix-turn-helix transcriptional regulator [Nitrososphaerota archaeon]